MDDGFIPDNGSGSDPFDPYETEQQEALCNNFP